MDSKKKRALDFGNDLKPDNTSQQAGRREHKEEIHHSILLNQAINLLKDIRGFVALVFNEYDEKSFKVRRPNELIQLLGKSDLFIKYVDHFVLRSPSDKMSEICYLMDISEFENSYGHLRYATGLLNTVIERLPKKKMPPKLTKKKQVAALEMAIYVIRELEQCARKAAGIRVLPDSSEI